VLNHGRPIFRGDLYAKSRQEGESDRFAAICALRRFPGFQTDDTFWAGRKHCAEVYGERYFGEVQQLLAQQGASIGAQHDYFPELAEYKGDPRAVVGHDARGHIKRVCEMKGVGCEGAVNVKGREPESDPLEGPPRLAPDLVEENFERFKEDNPTEAAKMSDAEITEHMTEKHGV
jgi:hypothetical protein